MSVGRPLIIWGARGHAKVLLDILRPPEYEVVAFFDNDPAAVSPVGGVPVHHGVEGFERWRIENSELRPAAVVAIGGSRGTERLVIARMLESAGCEQIHAVHTSAHVADSARLGTGCQVLVHACIGADAALGDACIVNTAASIDHECLLEDGVHVAPGATVAGCVTIARSALVGAGAVILPRIRIGSNAVVGAGAIVTKDVADGAVVAGNPARPRE